MSKVPVKLAPIVTRIFCEVLILGDTFYFVSRTKVECTLFMKEGLYRTVIECNLTVECRTRNMHILPSHKPHKAFLPHKPYLNTLVPVFLFGLDWPRDELLHVEVSLRGSHI